MGTRPPTGRHPDSSAEPPVPGGDPDQPPPDLPKPNHNRNPPKGRDHEEYGHVGVDDRPQSEKRPKPRQIY
jgi:hypothetical protein